VVHVVAFDREQRVLLVRQYRHPWRVWLGISGRSGRRGETLLATAQRELREESGAEGDSWAHLGGYHSNPARQANRVHGSSRKTSKSRSPRNSTKPKPSKAGFHRRRGPRDDRSSEFTNVMHISLFYRALDARAGSRSM